ncbi:leucine-rich repeat flightless-interacting protein 2-like isoform X3 [Lytechinus variegatus]|uniref:leucine-rich repeat flightless-interacting protein 2-like isoform X4 n=1 Tax=Lytechinus variegatus TaxID=7654 RepID=UPI001BB18B60|nr:leucine-rich repeat flightless-interacting protein 2-like isoform X4 [Lytechinus variegatus]XP_041479177.1 leucine-rich repeat flightless-interacting protein 2-like isoform X3 [Lytechinus variegatus]
MSVDAVELDVSTVGGGPNHSGPSPGGSAGRRRVKSRAYTAEDEALTDIAKAEAEKAETKLAQRRQARAEARKIRMLELEKQQKEVDEKMDMEYKMQQEEKKTYRHRIMMLTKQAEMVVAAGSGSSGSRPSSRRGSTESVEHDLLKGSTNSEEVQVHVAPHRGGIDPRELEPLKDAVADLEEKYKKSMMTNAQLDNEKSTLVYEVDCLKDVLADQEEHMMELSREARDKHRDLESKKRENVGLKREVDILREMVEQRDQLISEHGLLLVGGEQADGDSSKPVQPKVGTIVVVSPEAAELLEVVGDGPLDVRLKRFVEERKELLEQIRKLKIELEESKERAENAERRRANPITINGPDLDAHDLQREATKQVGEYKFKLQKAEQDITNLGGQVVRLEGQVRRYKTASEVAEKNEEELKLEKRKMSRELRILREKVEEVETSNTHLQKRLDKFIKRKPEH